MKVVNTSKTNFITLVKKNNDKHILLIIPSLSIGGAEKIVMTLAETMLNNQWNIKIVAFQKSEINTVPNPYSIPIIYLEKRRSIKTLFALRKILKHEEKISAISFITHTNLIVIIANFGLKKNSLIGVEVGKPQLWANLNLLKRTLLKFLVKLLYSRLEALIVVSNSIKEDLINLKVKLPKILKVIYNPIDVELIQILSKEEVSWPWLNIKHPSNKKKVILGIGRFEYEKGFDILIKSFIQVKNVIEDSVLVLIGDGTEKNHLIGLAHEHCELNKTIFILPHTSNPYKYIMNASMIVVPSRIEGSSLVISEALLLKKSIVSTKSGGPSELLENGRLGGLAEINNVGSLAKAIENEFSKKRKFLDGYMKALQQESGIIAKEYIELLHQINLHERGS